MVHIVGLGPGSRDYLLLKAVKVLEGSEFIIGFSRALESLDFIQIPKVAAKDLKDILNLINLHKGKKISIVASGDPCFYGISDYLKRKCSEELQIVPGISSFQYLMAALNKSWQGSFLGSLHGRQEDFLEKVRENEVSIWLTDKVNSPKALCKKLFDEKLAVQVYIGENLSYEDEKITAGTPEELMSSEFSDLSVVVIENDLFKG
jgi:cobalt-precorrin-7 (C5)-methyltransferase